ncbi:hypothetical protein EH32_15450 [Erythrobacter litoralis]|uniref:Uncharacterized protein n=1 Tax=Erythrobacter litoralis TaxID=39960 RepID=A0A074MCY0_9SPHN|nr:hypothetical protein EH32_15450 [Erythrobacter litoralis]
MPIAPAAAEQMREAALPEIFETFNDCFAATESGGISVASLEGRGWSRATLRSGDGEVIEGGPIFYGHAERAPIIILSTLEGQGVCMVNARIESFEVFEQFKQAFGGKLPPADDEGTITFMAEGRPVQIAPTGSREAPALRLAVLTERESN